MHGAVAVGHQHLTVPRRIRLRGCGWHFEFVPVGAPSHDHVLPSRLQSEALLFCFFDIAHDKRTVAPPEGCQWPVAPPTQHDCAGSSSGCGLPYLACCVTSLPCEADLRFRPLQDPSVLRGRSCGHFVFCGEGFGNLAPANEGPCVSRKIADRRAWWSEYEVIGATT